ncbi:hypothetical protein IMF23_02940 [Chelatococcus daeguensis]|uniref:Uncharacterized protein n=1 Tax=Chelatococcus daeguensis TaxID=444444 RepID=A0AAC9JT11_9HYPH|nr:MULTISPECIES: hypothetical protein [Chelatococcus]APF37800.1 hypothetical protein BOQ54_11055 [Chelatococcus daeguensis]KZE36752.1 hypothetical protein AVW15_01210 [Chelatococcus daeguensis]MBM3082388.1 hypothetical protein [Chelatococcus daeguensis]
MSVQFARKGLARATAVSAVILVGTEILGVAVATGWAIGGLMELGDVATLMLTFLLAAGGVAVLAKFTRRVIDVELKGHSVEILDRQPAEDRSP